MAPRNEHTKTQKYNRALQCPIILTSFIPWYTVSRGIVKSTFSQIQYGGPHPEYWTRLNDRILIDLGEISHAHTLPPAEPVSSLRLRTTRLGRRSTSSCIVNVYLSDEGGILTASC